MQTRSVTRDERSVMVDNASYRWAYLVLSFGVLASVAWRAYVLHEASWDLLGLVMASGLVATFYQAIHHVLTGRWALLALVTAVLAAVVAAGMVLMR